MGLTIFALKGGLLRTSPRLEYFWGALGVNPKAALASLLTQKKPEDVSLRVDLLPLNEDVLSQIEALKSADKAVALSTRDYPELATALAARFGLELSEAKGETRPQNWNARALLKAIRPHQWVKNILLLLPLLAAHRYDSGSLLLALLGRYRRFFGRRLVDLCGQRPARSRGRPPAPQEMQAPFCQRNCTSYCRNAYGACACERGAGRGRIPWA